MRPSIPSIEECPRRAEHTPAPSGYLAWHDWAQRMAQSHRQVRCSSCKRYVVWVQRGTNKRATDPVEPFSTCLNGRAAADAGRATGEG